MEVTETTNVKDIGGKKFIEIATTQKRFVNRDTLVKQRDMLLAQIAKIEQAIADIDK